MSSGWVWFLAIAILAALGAVAAWWLWPPKQIRWAVYYNKIMPSPPMRGYDLIVLDGQKHPNLDEVRAVNAQPMDNGQQKKTNLVLLGYLSFGEEAPHLHFPVHDLPNMLLAENPHWKGNHTIDIRRPEWQDFIIKQLIPDVLCQGFDGIFIDTMDSPLALEDLYPGMKKAGLDIIKSIQKNYPGLPVVLNRGFDILPEAAPYLYGVLAESTMAQYNWDDGTSKLFPASAQQPILDILKKARSNNRKLQILTLDYWDQKDRAGVARIYQLQRERGFSPYVSTVDLRQHWPEM